MKLNHINLCTSDVPRLSRLLTNHFSYRAIEAGKVPDHTDAAEAGADYAMLDGADGSSLVLTQIIPLGSQPYPTNFHFGIGMETSEQVNDKHRELTDAGYAAGDIKRFKAAGSRWTAFSCQLGDGMMIEVNHRSTA